MNRIKELRLAAGWKQVDFCKVLGVGQSTLSGYENGTTEPDFETLIKIATQFDVSIDYLLGHSATKKAPASTETSAALDYEIIQLMTQLNETNREKAIDHLQYLIARQEGNAKKK